jgi:hypothetical protein
MSIEETIPKLVIHIFSMFLSPTLAMQSPRGLAQSGYGFYVGSKIKIKNVD